MSAKVHPTGRGVRAVVTYLSLLGLGVLALTMSLLIGRNIEPAPRLPELGAVGGPASACLGQRVTALQSGEFVDLHQPGPAGAETAEEQLGDRIGRGEIHRGSGVGALRGTCSAAGRAPGRPYVAQFTAVASPDPQGRDQVSVEGMLSVADSEPLGFSIVAADPADDVSGDKNDERLTPHEVVSRVFLSVAIIILASRSLGLLLALARQPRVIGEMVAGILLGPSLMGVFFPDVSSYLFPAEVISVLAVTAQFGLIFFMFLIGLELEVKLVRQSAHLAILVSHASIILPLAFGSLLALVLYPLYGSRSFTSFALFMGTAMAITAFPVLARILTDTGIARTRLGALAITCAAVDDVTAWCILAVVVGIVNAASSLDAVRTLALSVVFVAGMMFVVRPQLRRLVDICKKNGGVTPTIMAGVIIGVLLSAWATDMIGIHAIFGAFLFGVAMPRNGTVRAAISDRLEDVTMLFLLPVFFTVVGLSTKFGLLDQWIHWSIAALVIFVAVAGKLGGSMFAARSAGMGWRESGALGLLMNTRGLTEIVILTVGRSLDVIPPALFTIMVLMALTTTLMTTPLLAIVYPARLVEEAAKVAAKEAKATTRDRRRESAPFRVVVGIDDMRHARPLIELVRSLHDPQGTKPQIVLTHVSLPPVDGPGSPAAPRKDDEQQVRGRLEMLARELQQAGHETRIRFGSSAGADSGQEFVRLAGAEDPDLVVLGGHRRGGSAPDAATFSALGGFSCDAAVLFDSSPRTDEELALFDEGSRLNGVRPADTVDAEGAIAVVLGSGHAAAMALAVRLAEGRGRPLRLLQRSDEAPFESVKGEVCGFHDRDSLLEAVSGASLVVIGIDDAERGGLSRAAEMLISHASLPVVVVRERRPAGDQLDPAASAGSIRPLERTAAVTAQ